MKKSRSFRLNSNAIAMIYDALLFLTFISLAGVILLPAFFSDNHIGTSTHLHHDKFVDETLHQLLITSDKKFNYTLAGDIINSFGTSIGINTTHSNGLYQSVTQWILGKQQHHKTYGEHIADVLFCQLEVPLSKNDTIGLNPLTKDYNHRLIHSINDALDSHISYPYHYQFIASWKPIKNINLGGTIKLGTPAPSIQHTYTATQTIHIPFMPMLIIDDNQVIITEQWLIHQIQNIIGSNVILKNISDNGKILTSLNNNNKLYNNYVTSQRENITSLARNIICEGLYDGNNTLLIPGMLSVLFNNYVSGLLAQDNRYFFQDSTYSLGYGFERFDEFISNISKIDTHQFQSYLTSSLVEYFTLYMVNMTINHDEIITTIIDKIIQIIEVQLTPIISSFVEQSFPVEMLKYDIDHLIVELIDFIFSHLSLTQAEVTLTIWDGRLT